MQTTEIEVKGTWVYFLGYAVKFDSERQALEFVKEVIREGIQ
jgi:hypothetical protein